MSYLKAISDDTHQAHPKNNLKVINSLEYGAELHVNHTHRGIVIDLVDKDGDVVESVSQHINEFLEEHFSNTETHWTDLV